MAVPVAEALAVAWQPKDGKRQRIWSRRRQMCVICMENRFSVRATFHAGRPTFSSLFPDVFPLSCLLPASRFPLFQLPEFRMQRNNSFAYKWISSVHLEIYPSIHLLVPPSTHCIFVYLLPSRR